ncbi:MAG: hypothetical protein ACOYN0_07990 [Phycisphaerales bacterium]
MRTAPPAIPTASASTNPIASRPSATLGARLTARDSVNEGTSTVHGNAKTVQQGGATSQQLEQFAS